MNSLSEGVFRFADRQYVLLRYCIAFVTLVLLTASVVFLGLHMRTAEKVWSGYSFLAIAMFLLAFQIINDERVVTHVIEGDFSCVSAPKGKMLNLCGPIAGVVLGYLYNEKFEIPISIPLVTAFSLITTAIFTSQMLLIPVKCDFGVLDSAMALIIGLYYRDYPHDWKLFLLVGFFAVILFTKQTYEAVLLHIEEELKRLQDLGVDVEEGMNLGDNGGNMPGGAEGGNMPAGAEGGNMPGGAEGGNMPAGAEGGNMPAGAEGGNMPVGVEVLEPIRLSSSNGSILLFADIWTYRTPDRTTGIISE
ncbi:hypothetical protein BC332_17612 [Capsicum chinense]|nr:hypothetical protein BC332_17612 [Capsicum chinense]